MYVSQYHIELPRSEIVKLYVRKHEYDEDHWQLLVVEDSAMETTQSGYRSHHLSWVTDRLHVAPIAAGAHTKILCYIASVARKLIVDTRLFRGEVLSHISYLVSSRIYCISIHLST